MTDFSEGQWVRIKNGFLAGLVGQVVNPKPEGHLLIAIRGILPTQSASVLICATKCEVVAQRMNEDGGNCSETLPPPLNE